MNLIAYARVSSEKQKEENTIELQGHAIASYCEKEGHNLIATFLDNGISGKGAQNATPSEIEDVANRVSVHAMFTFLKGRKDIDGVVVHRMDRWSRDEFVSEFLFRKLRQLDKVLVEANSGRTYESDKSSMIERRFKDFISHIECMTITERLKDGRAMNSGKGFFSGGKPPYGYKTERVKIDGKMRSKYVIDEEAMQVILSIGKMREKGIGYIEIADILNREGILSPSGKKWHNTTVHRTVHNPMLKGILKYAGNEAHLPDMAVNEVFFDTPHIAQKSKADRVLGKILQSLPTS